MPDENPLLTFVQWAHDKLLEMANDVIGSIEKSVDAIVDIQELDCGDNWIVYVKTALPAAGEALWMILTPSFGEILENYLEPKPGRRGGRRGRHGERERRPGPGNRGRVYFGGGIPDVDELIADRIPGRGYFKGRQIGPTEWVFWTGLNAVDRVLWYWLLLKATETFSTVWMSGMLESGACRFPKDGQCSFSIGQRNSYIQSSLWFNKFQLIGLNEENLHVGNNGYIRLPISNTRASCMVVVSYFFTAEKGTYPGTTILEVGFSVTDVNTAGSPIEVGRSVKTLICEPGVPASVLVDGVYFYDEFNTFIFQVIHNNLQNNGLDKNGGSGQVAMSVRNVHLV